MARLGFGKKYFLEQLMEQREKIFTLGFYRKKDQLNNEFMRKKQGTDEKKISSFLGALEFLNKELKKNPSM